MPVFNAVRFGQELETYGIVGLDLARTLGISPVYISHFKSGKAVPSPEMSRALALILHLIVVWQRENSGKIFQFTDENVAMLRNKLREFKLGVVLRDAPITVHRQNGRPRKGISA